MICLFKKFPMKKQINISNFDSIYDTIPSQLIATLKTKKGELRKYKCQREAEGNWKDWYIFKCETDGRGLNGYHKKISELVRHALTPIGFPTLQIKVFIASP